MTKDQLNALFERRKETMKNIGMSLPDWMVPKESCKCGTGIVWGFKNENGDVRYLKNESGGSVKICADCNDILLSQIYDRQNVDTAIRFHKKNEEMKNEKNNYRRSF